MPKRLILFGALLLGYLAMCFTVHLALHKSTLKLSSYRTMIASVPGRIYDPMTEYQVKHLSSQISKIEFGGDLRAMGLSFDAKPLSWYLNPASFDMSASLKLLNDGRLRAAQVKFDSLSSKIDTVYLRRIQLLSTLSKVAGVVSLILVLIFVWLWLRSGRHWSHEISVVGDPLSDDHLSDDHLSFEAYLQSVVAEEVKFVGHRASVSCHGFDAEQLPLKLKETVELIAEQLVRNSIEHGGRLAEERLLAGKKDYISVQVALQEQESSWLLSVKDDGEGLDANEIFRRALELKLLSAESANVLPAGQRIKLIFLNGFTTRRRAVSAAENDKPLPELMAIAKGLNGVISIQNEQGSYCQFSVRFPK